MSDLPSGKAVLAIDSSLGGCVGAVLHADGGAEQFSLRTDRDQAAKLIPLIQDCLKRAGLEFGDVGLIVTTFGPGSFTGLRIGLSAAKALSLSLSVPLIGVGTLEAMAITSMSEAEDGLVVLETKRDDFYVQAFGKNHVPTSEPACLKAADVMSMGPRLICGDGAARLLEEAPTLKDAAELRDVLLLDPVALARRGVALYYTQGDFHAVKPLYLRGADVSMSNKMQRQINQIPN